MYARLNNWTLTFDNKTISAQVPGDITIDLYRAGLVKNPYFGLDYKDIEWVARRDFTYRTTICADKELLNNQSVTVVFDGIDVFADVYLNGTHLGATKNMFLQYRYEIRNLLHEGNNTLTVEMHSTLNAMDKIDTTGYYAIFNEKRMFVRKAQCHFGWDWAPKICAYGIWNDVYVECGSKQKINDVYVVADDKGNAAFFVELNYNINSTYDTLGVMVRVVTKKSLTINCIFTYRTSLSPKPTRKKRWKLSAKRILLVLSTNRQSCGGLSDTGNNLCTITASSWSATAK